MIRILSVLVALTWASVAGADIIRTEAVGSVEDVTSRIEEAVTGAGATVFAKVPHSKGAQSVGMALNDATLVIFGNPKLGTPALQQDIHTGLILPLRVLVYADDDGQTWIAYEDIPAMFNGFAVESGSNFMAAMAGALAKFSSAAATN